MASVLSLADTPLGCRGTVRCLLVGEPRGVRVDAVVPYSVVSRTDRTRDVSVVRERRDHHKKAMTGSQPTGHQQNH